MSVQKHETSKVLGNIIDENVAGIKGEGTYGRINLAMVKSVFAVTIFPLLEIL